MAVKFRDYYDTLGVSRAATQDDIQRAYRKLARKYHPDVNKSRDAEDQFKLVGEAYEVLKDPEKRKRYDTLGENWKAGQEFSPPPGWDFFGGGQSGKSRGFRFDLGGSGGSGFSDFFDMLFGNFGESGFEGFWTRGREAQGGRQVRGQDEEAEISITLEEAYFGAKKSLALEAVDGDFVRRSMGSIEVTIPRGITEGKRLRLAGKGRPGSGGGQPGDLYLRVRIAPHPVFALKGQDIDVDVPVAPWEAVLGGRVEVRTPEGPVAVTLPAGIQSGQKMRLKGKGLDGKSGRQGDLFAVIRIVVPKKPSPAERKLFEELSKVSSFKPRD